MNYLYKIIFDDGKEFIGGNSLFNTRWNLIPNKKIKKIFYNLPNRKQLILKDFDKYFHMVEGVNLLSINNKRKMLVDNVYIMGKKDSLVKVYKINLKTSQVFIKNYCVDDKFILSLNKNIWK